MKQYKRAVSPVIAIVLLIALTVAAASVVWVMTSGILDDDNTEIIIESTNFEDKDGNKMADLITFNLRNLGSDDIKIQSINIVVDNLPFNSWILTSTTNDLFSGSNNVFTIETIDPAQQLAAQNTVIVTFTYNKGRRIQTLEVPSEFSQKQIGEAGSVVVGGTEVQVDFSVPYIDPVVVVTSVASSSASKRGGTDAAQTAVVTNVTKTSFKLVQTSDPSDLDGITDTEVNYIVMETGIHQIRTQTIMVGKIDASGSSTYYDFPANFTNQPALLASTQTNDMVGDPRSRGKFVTTNNFTIQIENGVNSNPGSSYLETVGFIAIEQGFEILSGLQAYRTADNVEDEWELIPYNVGYLTAPIVIAHLSNEDGGNAAYAVITEVETTNFKAAIEEPAGIDGNHTHEIVDWMAIASGAISGTTI